MLKSILGNLLDESICYQTILLNINYFIIPIGFHTEISFRIQNFYVYLSIFPEISEGLEFKIE